MSNSNNHIYIGIDTLIDFVSKAIKLLKSNLDILNLASNNPETSSIYNKFIGNNKNKRYHKKIFI